MAAALAFSSCEKHPGVSSLEATEGKAELRIDYITPESGISPVEITIVGSGFAMKLSDNVASINGEELTAVEASLTRLKYTIPYNPAGSYPVVLKVGDKTVEGPLFTYGESKGFTFTPEAGEWGTKITLNGSTFSTVPEENIVTIGGKQATVLSASRSVLVVEAPEQEEGTEFKIKVNVTGKPEMESEAAFKYGSYTYQPFVELLGYAQANCFLFLDDNTLLFGSYASDHPFYTITMASPKPVAYINAIEGNSRSTQITLCEDDGLAYVAFPKAGRVGRFDPAKSGSSVTLLDITPQITDAGDVKFDSEGNMYVLSRSGKAIYRLAKGNFTSATKFIDFASQAPNGDVIAFDFDWNGDIIVATQYYGLWRVSADGTVKTQLLDGERYQTGSPALKTGDTLDEITTLLVDSRRKDIYVNDASAKVVFVVRLRGGDSAAEVLSVADTFIPYGLVFSPSRDALYSGARWHHEGAIIKIPIVIK